MTYLKIDISEALDQLGGSEKLYKTLVNGFYDKYQNVDKDIELMLSNNEVEDARRLAHSIKGLSGNLGAKVFREKAMDLEYAIRDASEDVTMCLEAFSQELVGVISEVRHILANRYNDIAKPEVTIAYGEDVFIVSCYDLLAALETYKYSEVKNATEKFVATKVLLKYRHEAEKVLEHIENYDYDQAITTLRGLVNK